MKEYANTYLDKSNIIGDWFKNRYKLKSCFDKPEDFFSTLTDDKKKELCNGQDVDEYIKVYKLFYIFQQSEEFENIEDKKKMTLLFFISSIAKICNREYIDSYRPKWKIGDNELRPSIKNVIVGYILNVK